MNDEIFLKKKTTSIKGEVRIGGSKSESNRYLILNRLYGNCLQLNNLSDSDDTRLMKKALDSAGFVKDIHHAGTAMRFLTAFYAARKGEEIVLTGSDRMKNRPIATLIEALRKLGAEIGYEEKAGFPPLKITGRELTGNEIELDAGVSSQFITALMLIAPKLRNGLILNLKGEIVSFSYLQMTVEILRSLGIKVDLHSNQIRISPQPKIKSGEIDIESDRSSASYWYSLAALSESSEIHLKNFRKNSLQGDAVATEIFEKHFGIGTDFSNQGEMKIYQKSDNYPDFLELNLLSIPDLAQTLTVTCAGLKIPFYFTGLKTLKIKETDRLTALKNELLKVGARVEITEDSIRSIEFMAPEPLPLIRTYSDHRMALSFAALSMKMDLKIENPEVINKSYPKFWKDLERLTKN